MSEQESEGQYILLVDDDDVIRSVLRDVLEDEGCEVVTARNGREALEWAQRRRPSVILLDVRMPDLDGPAFARLYRETPGPHAPIVMVSALRESEVAARAAELGAAEVIPKPFDLERVLSTVAKYADCVNA